MYVTYIPNQKFDFIRILVFHDITKISTFISKNNTKNIFKIFTESHFWSEIFEIFDKIIFI